MQTFDYHVERRRWRLPPWWVMVIGVVVVGTAVAWGPMAGVRGAVAARVDMARGHYEIKTLGKPVPWIGGYSRLMQQRYHVLIKPSAGCMVSDEVESFMDGYNGVVRSRLMSRYGNNIFRECMADAWAEWATATLGRVYTAEEYLRMVRR